MRSKTQWIWIGALAALAAAGPVGAQTALTPEEAREATFAPTAAERTQAFALAARAIEERGLRARGSLYAVSADLFRDKNAPAAEQRDRRVVVTSYRYEGDLAIFAFLNLTRSRVLRVDTVAHMPVRLSEEEFTLARDRALGDLQVQQKLGRFLDRVSVEAMVSHSPYEKDPLFGHRVVRLLFRVDRGYLVKPVVFVDLSADRVLVDPEGLASHHSAHPTPAARAHQGNRHE